MLNQPGPTRSQNFSRPTRVCFEKFAPIWPPPVATQCTRHEVAAQQTYIVHLEFQLASSFNLSPPQDRTALFAKMDNSVKSGGTLIIQGYTAAQLKFNTGGPGKLDHMYDEAMMREAFVDYDIIDLQTYEAQIDEGTAHKGMSGLLGLTARKR